MDKLWKTSESRKNSGFLWEGFYYFNLSFKSFLKRMILIFLESLKLQVTLGF
jgi:hypothetical protein